MMSFEDESRPKSAFAVSSLGCTGCCRVRATSKMSGTAAVTFMSSKPQLITLDLSKNPRAHATKLKPFLGQCYL